MQCEHKNYIDYGSAGHCSREAAFVVRKYGAGGAYPGRDFHVCRWHVNKLRRLGHWRIDRCSDATAGGKTDTSV